MPDLDTTRTATCRCGQLSVRCTGDPVRISVCHCLNCQRRSGSSFSAQARWPDDRVEITGAAKTWSQTGDGGGAATFSFCPECGSSVHYVHDALPGLTGVAIGAFADPTFPGPDYSVYESRKHAWVTITGEGVDHLD